MAKKARDIMTTDVTSIGADTPVLEAAKKMRDLDVGALPICGEDKRLKGVITDRDIVVGVLAEGKDPGSTKAGEIGSGDANTVTIGADDSIDEALETMQRYQVRRLPVIDGQELVGIIAQADVATHVKEKLTGETVEAISR
jgi:CBS domain-containing protein